MVALEIKMPVRLVDPVTQPTAASFAGATRVDDLRNKVVGLVDDSKPNAKELLEEVVALLKARYGVRDVVSYRKPSASKAADPKVIADMGKVCDYAIIAIGD